MQPERLFLTLSIGPMAHEPWSVPAVAYLCTGIMLCILLIEGRLLEI